MTANRAWREFFATGIVNTAGDFGTQSEPPSHPQLARLVGDRSSRWRLVVETTASPNRSFINVSPSGWTAAADRSNEPSAVDDFRIAASMPNEFATAYCQPQVCWHGMWAEKACIRRSRQALLRWLTAVPHGKSPQEQIGIVGRSTPSASEPRRSPHSRHSTDQPANLVLPDAIAARRRCKR